MTVDLPAFVNGQLLGFTLVLARLGGLFVLAPVFSAHMIPIRVRALIATAIAFAMMPVALHGQQVPADTGEYTVLLLKEVGVGLAFAFPMAILSAAVTAGAGLLDTVIGFSFAHLVDPVNNSQNAILGQFYSLFAVMVFLLAGGDHIMLQGLAASYQELPVTAFPDTAQPVGARRRGVWAAVGDRPRDRRPRAGRAPHHRRRAGPRLAGRAADERLRRRPAGEAPRGLHRDRGVAPVSELAARRRHAAVGGAGRPHPRGVNG